MLEVEPPAGSASPAAMGVSVAWHYDGIMQWLHWLTILGINRPDCCNGCFPVQWVLFLLGLSLGVNELWQQVAQPSIVMTLPAELTKNPVEGFSAGLVDDRCFAARVCLMVQQ
jgi:hypothetical protein